MSDTEEYSISFIKANLLGFIILLPITAVYFFFYILIWDTASLWEILRVINDRLPTVILVVAIGIIVHELLHGITMKFAGGISWDALEFGFNLRGFSPYIHCVDPMDIAAYRLGIIMPSIVLGIIPYLISLMNGNALLMGFGFIFTISSGGDFIIYWLIRNIEPGTRILDHPDKIGCLVKIG